MTIRYLIPFLLITFGLAWGVVSLLIFFPDRVTSIFGEISAKNPLFMLAVYAPAIAALLLVMKHSGLAGLRRYLSRLLLWRVHWAWYLFLLAGIPLLYYGGAAVKGNLFSSPFPLLNWYEVISALAFMLILGPVQKNRWIYSCSKQLLERIIYAYGDKGMLDYTIIRPFNFHLQDIKKTCSRILKCV